MEQKQVREIKKNLSKKKRKNIRKKARLGKRKKMTFHGKMENGNKEK